MDWQSHDSVKLIQRFRCPVIDYAFSAIHFFLIEALRKYSFISFFVTIQLPPLALLFRSPCFRGKKKREKKPKLKNHGDTYFLNNWLATGFSSEVTDV